MKSKLLKLLTIIFALTLSLGLLTACGEESPQHTHAYNIGNFDNVSHWYECDCGEINEKSYHTIIDGKCVCGYEVPHTHSFASLKFDSEKHWYECDCGEKQTEEAHKGGQATCTQKATCEICNQAYGELIPHDYKTTVTAPTCTEKGFTTYTCSCGDIYIDNYVDALGHNYTEVVTTPTCTEKGYTTYTCSCGDSYVGNYVNALGHSYEEVVTAPTCEEQGYTTYTCHCNYSYVGNYVNALGHNYGDFTSNGNGTHTKTCANDNTHKITENCSGGEATETQKAICEVCNAPYGEVLGHVHNYLQTVIAPTCEEQGYTVYNCVCGDSYKGNYVNEKGHAWGVWLSNNNGTHSRFCAYDTNHKETLNCSGGTATCTQKAECVICLDTYGELLSHSYKAVVTPPTCMDEGYTTYTCHCNYSYKSNYVNALGHTYEEVVTDPTCLSDGYTTYTCRCGDSYFDNYVDAIGHVEVIDQAVEPTCTRTGLTQGKRCSVCKKVLLKQEVIPANGHDYSEVVTQPTCEQKGYTTYTCYCGDNYIDNYVDAKGHAYGEFTSNGDGTHSKTCKADNSHVVTENCRGGQATCTQKAVCEVCNRSYGETSTHSIIVNGKLVQVEDVVYSISSLKGTELIFTNGEIPNCYSTEEYIVAAKCMVDNCSKYVNIKVKADHRVKGYNIDLDAIYSYAEVERYGFKFVGNVPATCEVTGYATFDCDECQAHLIVKYKANHVKAVDSAEVTYPTCKTQGYTTYTCADCGETWKDNFTDIVDHNYIEISRKANAEDNTKYDVVFECTMCKEKITVTAEVTKDEPATCKAPGETVYEGKAPNGDPIKITVVHEQLKDHKVGGKVLTDSAEYAYSEIAALVEEDLVRIVGNVPSSCTVLGNATFDCEDCDTHILIKIYNDHDLGDVVVVAPKCEEGGYSYQVCKVCNKPIKVKGSETLATGHTWVEDEEARKDNGNGTYSLTFNCACGKELTIPDATLSDDPAKTYDSTCKDEGKKTYVYTDPNTGLKSEFIIYLPKLQDHTANGVILTDSKEYTYNELKSLIESGFVKIVGNFPASCEVLGLATFECDYCGKLLMIYVHADHKFENGACEVCGKEE